MSVLKGSLKMTKNKQKYLIQNFCVGGPNGLSLQLSKSGQNLIFFYYFFIKNALLHSDSCQPTKKYARIKYILLKLCYMWKSGHRGHKMLLGLWHPSFSTFLNGTWITHISSFLNLSKDSNWYLEKHECPIQRFQ